MLQLKTHYPLTNLNTLHLISTASSYLQLNNIQQIPEILDYIRDKKFLILGGGSNIILPTMYDGIVIHNQLLGIEVLVKDDQSVMVKAMSGENWDRFIEYTIQNGWYGLENLSLIPGSVGAAPIQNIGAYGSEVRQFIDYVEAYDVRSGELIQLSNSECKFSYRNSYFKTNNNLLIISVVFNLSLKPNLNLSYSEVAKRMEELGDRATPLDLRNSIIRIRQRKLPDPALIGNAGSFFHNPVLPIAKANLLKTLYPDLPVYFMDSDFVKISAGWLIDNLGLKGYTDGSVGVYNQQALVLVNHGGATAPDILKLARFIQSKVIEKYGIRLNIEPIMI